MQNNAAIINALLGENIERLLRLLLPTARRDRTHFYIGDLDGNAGQSTCINIGGQYPGYYHDFATGERGDPLALVMAVLKLSFPEAKRWAEDFLGQPVTTPPTPHTPQPQQPKRLPDSSNGDRALTLWREAQPIAGTLAERYLREHRGITLNPLPVSLRFHPRLWHSKAAQYFPALIAAVQGFDRRITGIQRIYLEGSTGKKPRWSALKCR